MVLRNWPFYIEDGVVIGVGGVVMELVPRWGGDWGGWDQIGIVERESTIPILNHSRLNDYVLVMMFEWVRWLGELGMGLGLIDDGWYG